MNEECNYSGCKKPARWIAIGLDRKLVLCCDDHRRVRDQAGLCELTIEQVKQRLGLPRWARDLLFRQLMKHPLPWKVDQDWTWEVIATDGSCVGKFQTHGDAQEMIDAANALQVYMVESKREADDHLRKLGYDDLIDDQG